MIKEYFEALDGLFDCVTCQGSFEQAQKYYYILEDAITELKSIKEAKPSEAMEYSLKLYKMVESAGNGKGFDLNKAWEYYNTIKQTLQGKNTDIIDNYMAFKNDNIESNEVLEDIFELIDKMYKKPVCCKDDCGEIFYEYYMHSTILYNPKTNEIEIYEYEFIARYKIEEYGITWWLKN